MPVSSISVIAFSTIITNFLAAFYGFGRMPQTPAETEAHTKLHSGKPLKRLFGDPLLINTGLMVCEKLTAPFHRR